VLQYFSARPSRDASGLLSVGVRELLRFSSCGNRKLKSLGAEFWEKGFIGHNVHGLRILYVAVSSSSQNDYHSEEIHVAYFHVPITSFFLRL
jgi:hypothetical protein